MVRFGPGYWAGKHSNGFLGVLGAEESSSEFVVKVSEFRVG